MMLPSLNLRVLILFIAKEILATPLSVYFPGISHSSNSRNIRHLPCVSRTSGTEGVCMFAIDCLKSNGTHLGTCIDRFYFGSCCLLHASSSDTALDIHKDTLLDNSIDSINSIQSIMDDSNSIQTEPYESKIDNAITKQEMLPSSQLPSSTNSPLISNKLTTISSGKPSFYITTVMGSSHGTNTATNSATNSNSNSATNASSNTDSINPSMRTNNSDLATESLTYSTSSKSPMDLSTEKPTMNEKMNQTVQLPQKYQNITNATTPKPNQSTTVKNSTENPFKLSTFQTIIDEINHITTSEFYMRNDTVIPMTQNKTRPVVDTLDPYKDLITQRPTATSMKVETTTKIERVNATMKTSTLVMSTTSRPTIITKYNVSSILSNITAQPLHTSSLRPDEILTTIQYVASNKPTEDPIKLTANHNQAEPIANQSNHQTQTSQSSRPITITSRPTKAPTQKPYRPTSRPIKPYATLTTKRPNVTTTNKRPTQRPTRPTNSTTKPIRVTNRPKVNETSTLKPVKVTRPNVKPSTIKPYLKPSSLKPSSVKPSSLKPSSTKPSSLKPSSTKPVSQKPNITTTKRPTTVYQRPTTLINRPTTLFNRPTTLINRPSTDNSVHRPSIIQVGSYVKRNYTESLGSATTAFGSSSQQTNAPSTPPSLGLGPIVDINASTFLSLNSASTSLMGSGTYSTSTSSGIDSQATSTHTSTAPSIGLVTFTLGPASTEHPTTKMYPTQASSTSLDNSTKSETTEPSTILVPVSTISPNQTKLSTEGNVPTTSVPKPDVNELAVNVVENELLSHEMADIKNQAAAVQDVTSTTTKPMGLITWTNMVEDATKAQGNGTSGPTTENAPNNWSPLTPPEGWILLPNMAMTDPQIMQTTGLTLDPAVDGARPVGVLVMELPMKGNFSNEVNDGDEMSAQPPNITQIHNTSSILNQAIAINNQNHPAPTTTTKPTSKPTPTKTTVTRPQSTTTAKQPSSATTTPTTHVEPTTHVIPTATNASTDAVTFTPTESTYHFNNLTTWSQIMSTASNATKRPPTSPTTPSIAVMFPEFTFKPIMFPDASNKPPIEIPGLSPIPMETTTPDVNITTTTEEVAWLPESLYDNLDYSEVCGRRMYPRARIVGGEKTTFGRWPWQISLRQWRTSTYLHKCGAALLSDKWAITAAHCVDNVPPSDLLLRLGEHDLSSESEPHGFQERRVQIVASHPKFDPRTFEYDLALLRFYEPVTFQPNIIPVCVPDDDENHVGKSAYVTGWGRLYEDGPLPSVLQEVSVPVINNTVCEQMYRAAGYIEHIPHIFICAGWKKGGFDSCEGDSGGPMVIQRGRDKRFILAGVISWGIGCAEPNQPGVYTRISEFRDWINKILQF